MTEQNSDSTTNGGMTAPKAAGATIDAFRIGRIGKPHGVRGEVSMQFSDDVFDRTDADYVFLKVDGLLVPFFIEEYRFRSDETVLMKFCDIDDADHARELTGCEVFFPRDYSADGADDRVTWAEIIGYSVVADDGRRVGTIKAVDDSTINILLDVVGDDGSEHLIPAVDDLIKDVDKGKKEIVMTIPDGLLNL